MKIHVGSAQATIIESDTLLRLLSNKVRLAY